MTIEKQTPSSERIIPFTRISVVMAMKASSISPFSSIASYWCIISIHHTNIVGKISIICVFHSNTVQFLLYESTVEHILAYLQY